MKLDYFLYMAESEGLTDIVDTRQSRLNAAIKDFTLAARNGLNIDDNDLQAAILEDYNLQDITTKEADYIATKVRKELYR